MADESSYLFGYADANYAENRNDRKSKNGYITKINAETVGWSCTKQKIVSLSSAEAQFYAELLMGNCSNKIH